MKENKGSQQRDFEKLALDCLGDARIGVKLQALMAEIKRMADGANAYGHRTKRRSTLMSAAKAVRRLQHLLQTIDPMTLVAATGSRHLDTGWPSAEGGTAPLGVPSIGAELIEEYVAFKDRLDRLGLALDQLAKAEPRTSRGRTPIPEAVSFGIECLAHRWKLHRGEPPANASRKAGGFGYFVERAFKLSGASSSSSQVLTGLRRFIEGVPSSR